MRDAAGLRLTGVPPLYGQLAIMGVMWVPAVATVLTVKLITREGFAITNLRIGSLKPYLVSALVIPACFAIAYGLTWLLGFGKPDWQLSSFRALMPSTAYGPSPCPRVDRDRYRTARHECEEVRGRPRVRPRAL